MQNETIQLPPEAIYHGMAGRLVRHPEFGHWARKFRRRLETGRGQGVTLTASPKPGRNEPCPCGSGKKFKHCHGGQVPA